MIQHWKSIRLHGVAILHVIPRLHYASELSITKTELNQNRTEPSHKPYSCPFTLSLLKPSSTPTTRWARQYTPTCLQQLPREDCCFLDVCWVFVTNKHSNVVRHYLHLAQTTMAEAESILTTPCWLYIEKLLKTEPCWHSSVRWSQHSSHLHYLMSPMSPTGVILKALLL